MSLDHDHEHGDEDSSVSSYYTYDSFKYEPDPHGFRDDSMWEYSPLRNNYDEDYDDHNRSERVLSRVEENSPEVEELSVYSPSTGEDWIRLGRAVGQNSNVIVLRVYADDEGQEDDGNPIITTEVQDAFCAGLAQNRSIEVFISNSIDYTSGRIKNMGPFFSHNANLVEIKLNGCTMDPGDIRSLTEAIKERGKNVKTIRSFTYSSAEVSPSQISALMDLSKTCTHLESLRLTRFRTSSDLSSCQAIATFLMSKKCMLKTLNLHKNPINDAGCMIITESLRINRRLKQLWINESRLSNDNDDITGQGFASFIPVVCDASSIDSTLNSNHTLELVNTRWDKRVPRELLDILEMNRNRDKSTVAKLKVLRYHFNGIFNIAGLDAKALPHLLAWFSRLKKEIVYLHDGHQLCGSALYRIIRHSPELCSYPSHERLIRLKAENQVATLNCELRDARKQIEALKREVEELRSDKRQKTEAK